VTCYFNVLFKQLCFEIRTGCLCVCKELRNISQKKRKEKKRKEKKRKEKKKIKPH